MQFSIIIWSSQTCEHEIIWVLKEGLSITCSIDGIFRMMTCGWGSAGSWRSRCGTRRTVPSPTGGSCGRSWLLGCWVDYSELNDGWWVNGSTVSWQQQQLKSTWEKEGKRNGWRTFTANTTHASLFWLLSDYQLVYPTMVIIVRTWVEGMHFRTGKFFGMGYGTSLSSHTPNNAVLDEGVLSMGRVCRERYIEPYPRIRVVTMKTWTR